MQLTDVSPPIRVREAVSTDVPAARDLHRAAFGNEGPAIGELVLALTADPSAQPLLSLVADVGGRVAGHVMFSAVHLEAAPDLKAWILAPLAVAPDLQRRGIGRRLIENGLDVLRQRGGQFVFVLGAPGYYGRVGFSSDHHVRAPYDLPYPDAWMALALTDLPLDTLTGPLRCARALDRQDYW